MEEQKNYSKCLKKQNQFFEKIKKPVIRLNKNKIPFNLIKSKLKEETLLLKRQKFKEKILRKYDEQMYANKLDSLDKMENSQEYTSY